MRLAGERAKYVRSEVIRFSLYPRLHEPAFVSTRDICCRTFLHAS
jgi:hypothetical protein